MERLVDFISVFTIIEVHKDSATLNIIYLFKYITINIYILMINYYTI